MKRFHRLVTRSIVAITLALSVEPAPAQLVVFRGVHHAHGAAADPPRHLVAADLFRQRWSRRNHRHPSAS